MFFPYQNEQKEEREGGREEGKMEDHIELSSNTSVLAP